MKKMLMFAVLGMAALHASAEKADAAKRAAIDYDDFHADNVTQTLVATGNVIVTKGTLLLKAERADYKDTPATGVQVVLHAAPGKLATFRQKRDGGPDLWIEGEAKRIEYNERTSVVKLFGSARVRQLEGTRMTSENQNEFISYDSMREVFDSKNDASGANKPGGGRGRIILEPSRPVAPAPMPKPIGTP